MISRVKGEAGNEFSKNRRDASVVLEMMEGQSTMDLVRRQDD